MPPGYSALPGYQPLPWEPVQCLTTLLVKKCFLKSNLDLPWSNLNPFPLILSLITWERKQDTHLATFLFCAPLGNPPHTLGQLNWRNARTQTHTRLMAARMRTAVCLFAWFKEFISLNWLGTAQLFWLPGQDCLYAFFICLFGTHVSEKWLQCK